MSSLRWLYLRLRRQQVREVQDQAAHGETIGRASLWLRASGTEDWAAVYQLPYSGQAVAEGEGDERGGVMSTKTIAVSLTYDEWLTVERAVMSVSGLLIEASLVPGSAVPSEAALREGDRLRALRDHMAQQRVLGSR